MLVSWQNDTLLSSRLMRARLDVLWSGNGEVAAVLEWETAGLKQPRDESYFL